VLVPIDRLQVALLEGLSARTRGESKNTQKTPVLPKHRHADHDSGLKRMLGEYGSRHFFYPKLRPNTSFPAPLA
jgi:hypothetical protein